MQLLRSYQGFPGDASGTDLPTNAGDMGDVGGFDPWVRKISWRRK